MTAATTTPRAALRLPHPAPDKAAATLAKAYAFLLELADKAQAAPAADTQAQAAGSDAQSAQGGPQ